MNEQIEEHDREPVSVDTIPAPPPPLVLVVYVAGPFRGPTAWAIESNVRRAEELALEVARSGMAPLCPHTNTRFFHGTLDDDFWLAATMALLRTVDAVVLTDDWARSSGARAEVVEAERLGIPVFETVEALTLWSLGRPAVDVRGRTIQRSTRGARG